MVKRLTQFFILFLFAKSGMGHPMPHSVLSFYVQSVNLEAELRLPLKELQFAVPFDVTTHTEDLLQEHGEQLSDYIMSHLSLQSINGKAWKITINEVSLSEAEQTATGNYQELDVRLLLQPPPGESNRSFNLFYDGILHQVATHKIFVNVKQDWQNGIAANTENNLGVIELDIANNDIPPMQINLAGGSKFKGFKSMVWLGIHHIAEGTDHLLFLLVLLLPSMLLADKRRWTKFGGTHYSLVRLLKLVTAFTLGHSISLFFGSMQWLSLPQQPVEIAIAITIFVTALHALRPIFPYKEVLIASSFGLIHGLAFSTILSELHLSSAEMLLSILGFNIGIELMQLFVILLTMPWLIILAKNKFYHIWRISGAIFAIIASLAWTIERITDTPNMVSIFVQQIFNQGKWIILVLPVLAAVSYLVLRYKSADNQKSIRQSVYEIES
ncbi:MAG: HupE/UreJ family protein [Bacteroidetes bacterium]|nr:HupE/UreJ family protein [Bacteroidota bacterium]